MKIAILGFGNVGKKQAEIYSKAGYEVIIGLRELSTHSFTYPTVLFADAIVQADAISLAIPYSACAPLLEQYNDLLSNKIIIDSTNPLNDDWSPLLLGEDTSAAQEIAKVVPSAHVIKAFNTIFADVMDKPIHNQHQVTAFIAGDHKNSKAEVMILAEKIGYAPLDTGPLATARLLESLAHLNIQIAVGQQGGTNAAFVYSR